REARETYARLAAELEGIIANAQRALAGDPSGDTELVFNSAPHTRRSVPARGASSQATDGDGVTPVRRDGGGYVLDNGLLRVEIDGRGLVVSAYDRAGDREAIAPGQAANLLQLHPDFPNQWDAWDVDAFYRNVGSDLTDAADVRVDGGAVRVER
ncbi:glycoside hydrolase family 38 C-terminal domain-containing protein, partial [Streptomyces sp. MCAF7]